MCYPVAKSCSKQTTLGVIKTISKGMHMSEHFPVSAREQSNDYCRSPEYFRSLDTPLPLEDVAKLRRLHEPVRYSEDGRRRIPIEKEYSDLYKLIYESSLRDNDDELQRFRAMSAGDALRGEQPRDALHGGAPLAR